MKKYICPQCGEWARKLCGPIAAIDLDPEYEDIEKEYFECPECGYRDEKEAFTDEEE